MINRRIPVGAIAQIFLFALLSGSLVAEVRVATYNIRNYLMTDRLVDGTWRQNYPKPENEKTALREIIAREKPDILAIQEMGTAPYLQELLRDLKRINGIDYPHYVLMDGADPDRHLAFLSKLPFEKVLQHKDLGYNYFGKPEVVRRGLLEAQFKTDDVDWSLYTVHLKSKWTERDDDPESAKKRESEATAVRNFLKKKHPPEGKYPYLLVGDCNDTPNAKPIARILNSGKNRLTRYVYCKDSRSRIWTHYWRKGGTYAQVDYIFASYGMLEKYPGGKWPTGYIEDSKDTLTASDHRLVWLDLPF